MNANTELPQNLQDLIANLSTVQAVPLNTQQGIPFLIVKIPKEHPELLEDNAVTCEFKPSIFNIVYKDDTIALCIVQFRLNGSDSHIYTATYDLNNDKQFSDCHALLAMRQYGLLVASETHHAFLQFDTRFDGEFDPQEILSAAREKATDYAPVLFSEIAYGLTMQANSPAALWDYFESVTPFKHQWYAAMAMQAEKAE
jgi:hypothetical protein